MDKIKTLAKNKKTFNHRGYDESFGSKFKGKFLGTFGGGYLFFLLFSSNHIWRGA